MFFLTLIYTYGQENNLEHPKNDSILPDSIEIIPKINRLKISFNYSSANTFLGRNDTVSIPLLSPSFKYTSHTNFFTQLSLVHTNTTSSIFDELDLKLGYRYFLGDRFDFSVSYTRFFFNSNVSRLNSLVNHDFNLYAGYDFEYFYSGLSFDYTYGKKSYTYVTKKTNKKFLINAISKDYAFSWMNYRQFYLYDIIKSKDKLIVTPEIDLILGTQNSVHLYVKKSNSNYSSSPIQPRALILNLDLIYVVRNFSFNLSPYETIPFNSSESDSSKPYFVLYGGIYYTWKWEKKEKRKVN